MPPRQPMLLIGEKGAEGYWNKWGTMLWVDKSRA